MGLELNNKQEKRTKLGLLYKNEYCTRAPLSVRRKYGGRRCTGDVELPGTILYPGIFCFSGLAWLGLVWSQTESPLLLTVLRIRVDCV